MGLDIDGRIERIIETEFAKFATKVSSALRKEAPIGRTGHLMRTIRRHKMSNDLYEVRITAPYANIVVNGRGPVEPIPPNKVVSYIDYVGKQTSVHKGTPGYAPGDKVSRRRFGKYDGNDFIDRVVAQFK